MPRGDAPCGHVRHVLTERRDQVRAQIAELVTLETHLETLLTHANEDEPTDHDNATVCWILESDPGQERRTPTPGAPSASNGAALST